MPTIVASNTVFPTDEDGKIPASLRDLKEAMEEYDAKDYHILERSSFIYNVYSKTEKTYK